MDRMYSIRLPDFRPSGDTSSGVDLSDPASIGRALGILLLVLVAIVWLPLSGRAQDIDLDQRFTVWDQTADRAEEALQAGLASSDAFEILRAELAGQRSEAEALVNAGSVRIRTLKAQIQALGPPPAKDAVEPDGLAQRRKRLVEQLASAEEPVLEARQVHARLNVLIEEIDRLVRSRSASDLLEQRPSPLRPSSWSSAATDLGLFASKIAADTRQHQAVRAQEDYVGERLLPALLMLAAAIIVPVSLGHALLVRLEQRIAGTPGTAWFLAQAAGVHALRLLLSGVGAFLLMLAYVQAEIGPTTTENLSGAVIAAAVIFVLANWLGNILFAPHQPAMRLVYIDDGPARACYWLSMAFAVALSVDAFVDGAADDFAFKSASLSVLEGISIAIGCAMLFGLSRILLAIARDQRETAEANEDDNPLGASFLIFVARFMQVLALASLLAAAVGFVQLAGDALSPLMLSLTIFGLAYVLHHALMVPLRVASGTHSAVTAISVLLGTAVLLACVPLLALVWGARVTDLSEAWRLLQNGVDLGGVQLSPKVLLVLIGTFLVGVFLTRWLQRVIDRVVLPRTRIDAGGRNAIRTGLTYVGVTLSALLAVSTAGIDLSNLAIIAGALSLGVAFGLQAIVSNFVSGIILLIERPIKEGDWIEVSGFSGTVRKIAVRSTRIETFDRHDVIIPNANLISGTVKNMTLSSRTGRMIIPVVLTYDADIDRARNLMLDLARSHAGILARPEPQVVLLKYGASGLELELRAILKDVGTETTIRSELLWALRSAFADEGIRFAHAAQPPAFDNPDQIIAAFAALLARVPRTGASAEPAADDEKPAEIER